MPLEVRELIIKATILQEGKGGSSPVAPSEALNNNVTPNEEIITACVERVLEIINEKNGR